MKDCTRTPSELWVSLDSWADRANCKGVTATEFFMEVGQDAGVHWEAFDVCSRCEVKNECLEHALEFERFGIWGGTTEVERIRIRRQRRFRANRLVSNVS